jgi:hypothetical protein
MLSLFLSFCVIYLIFKLIQKTNYISKILEIKNQIQDELDFYTVNINLHPPKCDCNDCWNLRKQSSRKRHNNENGEIRFLDVCSFFDSVGIDVPKERRTPYSEYISSLEKGEPK